MIKHVNCAVKKLLDAQHAHKTVQDALHAKIKIVNLQKIGYHVNVNLLHTKILRAKHASHATRSILAFNAKQIQIMNVNNVM